MIEAPHYTPAGAKRDSAFALPTEYYDGTVNEPVLHQAVRVFLNNQRQGTAATKTRSFVSGGNQKPWKQKGTGRARQGSTRAPHWRGGGTVFGPQPRDYHTEIPRKVKQLARKSALNARAREGALHVIERFAFRKPRTAQLARLLDSLELDGRKVLVLTANGDQNVYLSGRNLPTVEVMPYDQASAYDVLWSDAVVVEEGALTGVMPEPLPDEPEAEEEAPAPRKRASAAKSATSRSEKAEKPKPAPSRSEGVAKAAKPAPSRSEGKATKAAKPAKAKATKAAKKPAKKSATKAAKKPAPKKKGKK
jgi:large subunit ribosomal protein L4